MKEVPPTKLVPKSEERTRAMLGGTRNPAPQNMLVAASHEGTTLKTFQDFSPENQEKMWGPGGSGFGVWGSWLRIQPSWLMMQPSIARKRASLAGTTAAERIWHIQDRQGQIMAFKVVKPFKVVLFLLGLGLW